MKATKLILHMHNISIAIMMLILMKCGVDGGNGFDEGRFAGGSLQIH